MFVGATYEIVLGICRNCHKKGKNIVKCDTSEKSLKSSINFNRLQENLSIELYEREK